jgi:hypothetical protein
MEIYLFKSDSRHQLLGFTTDSTGANLPAQFQPWTKQCAAPIGHDHAGPIGDAIQRDGVYVTYCVTIPTDPLEEFERPVVTSTRNP